MITKKVVLALAALGLVAFAAPTVYAQDPPADDSMMADDSIPDVPPDPDAAENEDDSMSYPEDGGSDMGDSAADYSDTQEQ